MSLKVKATSINPLADHQADVDVEYLQPDGSSFVPPATLTLRVTKDCGLDEFLALAREKMREAVPASKLVGMTFDLGL